MKHFMEYGEVYSMSKLKGCSTSSKVPQHVLSDYNMVQPSYIAGNADNFLQLALVIVHFSRVIDTSIHLLVTYIHPITLLSTMATSMAAALAASLPAPVLPTAPVEPQTTKVPQRLEGFVDPEAQRNVESIKLNSLVFMKMLKHSTDTLPSPPAPSYNDRAAPPSTHLTSHVDAYGVLLGLDLDGVLEVEDSFALPTTETSVGGE